MHRYILLVLLFFTAVFVRAQEINRNVYNNNTNTNTVNPAKPGTQIQVSDTVSEQLQMEEIQVTSKKKVSKSVLSPALEEQEIKSEKDSNSSMQQLKSAKYQFETNYSNSTHQLTRRSASNEELLNMKQGAQVYASMLPGSFEKHFYAYLLDKYSSKKFPELQQAAKLNPGKTEVQQELAVYGIAFNNQQLADSVTVQMIKQDKISGGLLTYATDLVNSVPANGTLVLHGYTELIPVNYQVNALGRSDMQLISADLMESEEYQANLVSRGFILPNSTFVDTTFVQTFCELNTAKNIYLSMSFPKEYFTGMASSLNTSGLTFAYNQSSLDYNTWNSSLIETKWNKQKLGISTDQQADALSANYLPALISIEKLYREYNKTEQAKEISQIITNVATRARKTGQLSKIKR
ncbi:hypothetical protein D3C87_34410 [compost metagenome]